MKSNIVLFGILTLCMAVPLVAREIDEALMEAAEKGRQATVFVLLQEGADAKYQNNGCTALYVASLNGHVPIAKQLIDAGAEVNAKNSLGWAPLHVARNGKMVDLLLVNGAQLEAVGVNDDTPLQCAVADGRCEVVKVLLARGANLNTANNAKYTPLHSAADRMHGDVLATLLAQPHRNMKEIVNAVNVLGRTPLHVAAHDGNSKSAALLIKAGARVNVADNTGLTPLHMAACRGDIKTAEELLRVNLDASGINIEEINLSNLNARDSNGQTPLHLAVVCGKPDMVKYLLQEGVDPEIKDNRGYTAYSLINELWFEDLENKPTELERMKADLRNSFGDAGKIPTRSRSFQKFRKRR